MTPRTNSWHATNRRSFIFIIAISLWIASAFGSAQQRSIGYTDTPMLPGGQWHVHDGTRPQPAITINV